ncbi:MAG: hypothetical protein ACM3QS_16145 [Bacteroidota bacterium]
MAILTRRLPEFRNIIPVYAVIAFVLYMWSFFLFSWILPSWVNFMSVGELFAAFSYSLATTLLESLGFLLLLLLLSILLPPAWLRDLFVVRGTLISLAVLGVVLLRAYLNTTHFPYPKGPGALGAAAFLLALLLTGLSGRANWLRRFAAWLADRLIVFLYILVPLTVIGLVTVLVRNVF